MCLAWEPTPNHMVTLLQNGRALFVRRWIKAIQFVVNFAIMNSQSPLRRKVLHRSILMLILVGIPGQMQSLTPRHEPLKLHPANPHYFLFRGKPTVLITSGEHYGAVLNSDFDYKVYLDTLQKE